MAWQIALALVYFHATMLWASAALAGILFIVLHTLEEELSWWHWIALSPVIYIAWLNAFLIACAIEMQFWRPATGYRKPRRATNLPDDPQWLPFFQTMGIYMRQRFIWSLPLAQSYLFVPGLRHLVWWSYATSAHVGPNSVVLGCLYDPDLTQIADDCIVGAAATISAHSYSRNLDGSAHLVTAPVSIGARAVVGGNSRIDPGVHIGEDAIIEPCSYVTAFTTIGPGEVWGGNPARFVRLRRDRQTATTRVQPEPQTLPARQPEDTHASEERQLREIVAMALERPVEAITADLGADNCARWDSLAQLAIAAGLHARLGLQISSADTFRLRSMQELRSLVRRSGASATMRSDDPS